MPMSHIVNIQSNEVRRAMHEVLFVGRPSGVLLFDVVTVNELQVEQLCRHQVADLFVVIVQRNPWSQRFIASFITESTAL